MEALILALIIAYAVKKAAEGAHEHWQGARSANRSATRGQPVRQRAASAARHDTAYWAEQVRGGFPQVRHGLYMGWHAGRIAQLDGREARAERQAEHAETRARVTEAVREQRRRQDEALDRIRAAAQPVPEQPPRRVDGQPETDADKRFLDLRESGYTGPIDRAGLPVCPQCHAPTATPGLCPTCQLSDGRNNAPVTPPTEGNTMSGDTNYRQQMAELEAIRASAEEEVNSTRRKMMTSRLDILSNMGLDAASLAEAAAIDDALQAQEKAARQTLDAADAAIAGLKKRHGGIQQATDDAPVDKPADPDFYTD